MQTTKTTTVAILQDTGDGSDDNPGHSLNTKLQDATGNRFLSREEFCEMFNISLSTSERWARIGHGPRPVKIGLRRVGYRLSDVLAFGDQRQEAAA